MNAAHTTHARRGVVAWVTLDSPATRNALSIELVAELVAEFGQRLREPFAYAQERIAAFQGMRPARWVPPKS